MQLIEKYRASLARDEDRIRFLKQDHMAVYLLLVEVCLRLSRNVEAFEIAEKIKSRVLVELLSQPDRRPIDYQLVSRMRELSAARDSWIDEFVGFTLSDDWSEDWRSAPSYLMLERIIEMDRQEETIETQIKVRGLLDNLESRETGEDFASIRSMLNCDNNADG